MSEIKRVPLSSCGHKLTPCGNGLYICPSCLQPSLFVDVGNEQDIGFTCANDCSRFQILDAVGAPPDAIVYAGSAPAAQPQEDGMEPIPEEKARQWLELFSVSTFPDFVRLCKKNNNGSIPQRWEGTNLDSLAAAFGYKITSDRKAIYQPPSLSTAASLLQKELKPPIFAVEGLLPAGLCIFSAPSKTGKSWLALDLCNAVANGLPFMGRNTNKGDALYLALEDSEYGLQRRMKKIACTGSDSLHYAFTVPVVGGGMNDFLADWASSVAAPRLIVIDVLQRAKPSNSGRKTAYEQDYDLYAPLNAFALAHGLAIVAITHNRKSNGLVGDDYESISGSVGQMGAAQTTWIITGKRGQKEEKTLKATGRDIREVEDLIRFNPDTCRWENLGNVEEAEERKAKDSYATSPIRKTLIELLAEDGTNTWLGTYEDLFLEIANRTGQYPFTSADDLSKGIRPLEILLAQNDGILKKKEKNKINGRYGYHKWFRQNLMGE